MAIKLEDLVNKLARTRDWLKERNLQLDSFAARTLKPLERVTIPASVFLAASFESFKLGNYIHSALKSSEATITRFAGEVGYNLIDTTLTYVPPTLLEALIAIPATVALVKYYQGKVYDPSNSIARKLLRRKPKLRSANRLRNKLLPLMVAAETLQVAYSDTGFNDALKDYLVLHPLAAVSALTIAGLGISAASSIKKYLAGEKRKAVKGLSQYKRKAPYSHAIAALSLITNIVLTPEIKDLAHEASTSIMSKKNVATEVLEGIVEEERKVMTYFDAAEHHSKFYGSDPDLVKGILVAETKLRHTDREGNPIKSGSGAKGIGQHMPDNIIELNNLIAQGKLKGPTFTYNAVVKNASENIRATAATVKYLLDIFHDPELVLAAYNSGQGSIRSAIRRKHSRNFWNIVDKLPDKYQTVTFVQTAMAYRFLYSHGVSWPTEKDPANKENINSPFGPRRRDFHKGIDISPLIPGRSGDAIRSIAEGRVISAGRSRNNGVHVKIMHGKREFGLETFYLHGLPGSLAVSPGDYVTKGQLLMLMGNSGESTGPHLHFQAQISPRYGRLKPQDPDLIFKAGKIGEVEVNVAAKVKATVEVEKPTLIDRVLNFAGYNAPKKISPEALTSYSKGNFAYFKEDYVRALKNYRAALKYTKRTTMHDDTLEKLGDCYAKIAERDKSDFMYKKANEMYQRGLELKGDRQDSIKRRIENLNKQKS